MDWLSINDFIIPTNPLAALFFGIAFAVVIGLYVWFDQRQFKVAVFSSLFAIVVVAVLVGILYIFGYYS